MHHEVAMLLILLVIATSVAVFVQYVRLPYTVALVLGGLVLGLLNVLPDVRMTPEIVMTIFLPILLFEAAINIDYRHLRQDLPTVIVLAGPGVVLGLVVTALCMHLGAGLAWPLALLFGAMVVATDPVSVVALFKQLGISPRLTALVESESLLNDGTAIVAFQIVLAIVLTGHFDPLAGLGRFVFVCLGGVTIGLALGYAAILLFEKIEDHQLELMITAVLAYGAYLVADVLQVSGVIAVVTAGILVGNLGWNTALSETGQEALATFWEFAAFVCNSLIFLLIGLQIHLDELRTFGPLIGIGVLALFAGRVLAIYPLVGLMNRCFHGTAPWRWTHILVWGNLKGALSMALVMSLPADVPLRQELLVTLFGVVLFSLLGPGLTMGLVLKWLKIDRAGGSSGFELQQAEVIGLQAALQELDRLFEQGRRAGSLYHAQRQHLEARLQVIEQELMRLQEASPELAAEQNRLLERHLLTIQKNRYREASHTGLISSATADSLLKRLNQTMRDLNS